MLPTALTCVYWATFIRSLTTAVPLKSSAPGPAHKFSWDRTRYVYAFGDSYTFVQGTEGLPTFSFIGDAFHFAFTPQELLDDEIVPKNTSSDGSNWVRFSLIGSIRTNSRVAGEQTEFLTGCFKGKPSNCAPHQLWNFAFAGADVDKALLPLHHNFTVDLVDEVKQWAAYASDVVPHPPAETLVAWWIGINDTGDTLNNKTITDFHAFWELEMKSLFGAVQNAYDHDLRGTYLFFNVPPMERSPDHLGTSIAPTYKQHILDYNAALATHVAAFAKAHLDVIVLSFDAHTWFNTVLNNAEKYGFKNITGFCECKDPDYFWFSTWCTSSRFDVSVVLMLMLMHAVEAELLDASARLGNLRH
ncbi:Carbohydrate Esterase Family 16 protein [Trametes cinnabarina]|uniref:Carbohydrate Esterase Family 16 protein n=1 Tax=Pycnoporus cinnabarinus TaxID=5643 RepID=A0A060SSJ5_PYCCI|nr:Carbohydrate Esterase Family 16 protein [Trametes cinnabarina]